MAIPSLVTELRDEAATVECFGAARTVSLALMSEPVHVGDYVLIRSGRYVVELIDRESALEALAMMEQLLGDGEDGNTLAQQLGLAAVEA
jgi:hydrogenase expression/formation protein HypC